MKKVLSIAGSDSGGGAGIQADLKTFAAYRVYGMTAITAITAQNTLGVTAIQGIDPEIIRAQIEAVVTDIGVDTAKTGMLHSAEVIETVSDMIKKYKLRTVVDPVMVSTSGSELLKPEAKNALVELLLPYAEVVTPNIHEAGILSEIKIKNISDAKYAAEIISGIGSKAVLIKGGHLETPGKAIDILYHNSETTVIEGSFHETKNTHGTGCSLSSAIAAELAYGKTILDAVKGAKDFVNKGIMSGIDIGKGPGPVNPMASLYDDAERYKALDEVRLAVSRIEKVPELKSLVAECQMNVGVALSYARDALDIAAVDGRLTKHMEGVKTSGCPRFGASRHIASTLLAAREFDKSKRAGMNLKYSEEIVKACQELGLTVSYYDRREEPEEIKNIEGMTTRWGSKEAVKRIGKVPDALYHLGDWGKEPMIVLLGESADQVVDWAIEISIKISD
jgi:hydroxymethylpyrimidine kinase / phosphomethylpyrimidine kinase / thiamine-phosphate diphosphorylase